MTAVAPRRTRRVLLYGDVNLNILDGSAIWLVSIAEVLSRTHSQVHVLLKAPVVTDRLTARLGGLPNVVVHHGTHADGTPLADPLEPAEAATQALRLHRAHTFDVVIARGFDVCRAIAETSLLGRLWAYVTDMPFPATNLSHHQNRMLPRIFTGCSRVFAQTEDARGYIEGTFPAAAGKTLLLPPMIPDELFAMGSDEPPGPGLRLIYSGKFAKEWRTLEMCGLGPRLADHGVDARVTLVGDKFQKDRRDRTWESAMRKAVAGPAVVWAGGMAREAALDLVGQSDIGLSWRSPALDDSLEISTKVLEYCAAGVPPLVNRTAAHEDLLGRDYPLMVDTDDVDHVAAVIAAARPHLHDLRRHVREAVGEYSMSRAAARLERAMSRALTVTSGSPRRLRVVLAAHDLKFAGELIGLLRGDDRIDLQIDQWHTLHTHNRARSDELLAWADVIVCEWAGPNAVWYSQRRRPEQSMIVRLHRFELNGPWIDDIAIGNVDRVVVVSDVIRDSVIERLRWPADRITVVPNAIDQDDLARLKLPGAGHRLGLIGIVPFLKRPDRALDVLATLLADDDRWTLHIRGRMPWEYSYEWKRAAEQDAYHAFFRRIADSAALRRAVVNEPFGSDMGSWFRKIGFVLSPSSFESFHLAPIEGMASGAVPVVWDRPGARGIFPDWSVVDGSAQAARLIADRLPGVDDGSATADIREFARRYDIGELAETWRTMIFAGDRAV